MKASVDKDKVGSRYESAPRSTAQKSSVRDDERFCREEADFTITRAKLTGQCSCYWPSLDAFSLF